MATKKQKEYEELLIEKNCEIDALTSKVTALEAEIKRYHERETSIVAALTTAIQTKTNLITDAEKKAISITSRAEKEAAATLAAAEDEAKRIMAEAKKNAEEFTKKSSDEMQKLLVSARTQAREYDSHYARINRVLMQTAQELYAYIERCTEDFAKPKLADNKVNKKRGKKTSSPESYETPEELFHECMRLSGREAPEGVLEQTGEDAQMPVFTHLESPLLDDTQGHVSRVVDMSENVPKEPEKPVEGTEDEKDNEEIRVATASEIAAEADANSAEPIATESEADELAAILRDVFGVEVDAE